MKLPNEVKVDFSMWSDSRMWCHKQLDLTAKFWRVLKRTGSILFCLEPHRTITPKDTKHFWD